MWEAAPRFGALLLFAEHRYYGDSQPFGADSWRVDPTYLTTEQALADYAVLLADVKARLNATRSAVVAFGGSYGGMLAAWLRLKFPHLVDGAIAASAPLGAFLTAPGFEASKFWEVVTRDAGEGAGAAPGCAQGVRRAFALLLGSAAEGGGNVAAAAAARRSGPDGWRERVARDLALCKTPRHDDDIEAVAYWLQGAFDAYAMGK